MEKLLEREHRSLFLSWVHFAGMASIPFLGYNIHHAADYNKALTLHQNVAAVTLVTMSISALLTFLLK